MATAVVSHRPSLSAPFIGIIDFHTDNDVLAFIEATLSPKVDLSALEGIHFSSGALSNSAVAMIMAFFLRFSADLKITHISIDDAEAFFGSCPGLLDVFAMFTTIKYLTLHGIGIHGRRMLRNLRSSLVSADLAMLPLDDPHSESVTTHIDEEGDGVSPSPIDLLHGSQATLETFTGFGCETLCVDDNWVSRRSYPEARTIDLADNDIPITIHYAHAFPNLYRLRIETSREILSALGINNQKSLARVRERNQVEQLQFGTWNSLQACCAPLIDHFMLGLTCPVAELRILGPFMNTDILSLVLECTRPSSLILQGFPGTNLFTQPFKQLLGGPYATQLTLLQLTLSVLEEDPDVAAWLEEMIDSLHPLCIRSFVLYLNCFFRSRLDPRRMASTYPAETFLEGVSIDALATRIMQSVPSLKTVAVVLDGHPRRPLTRVRLGDDAEEVEEYTGRSSAYRPTSRFE